MHEVGHTEPDLAVYEPQARSPARLAAFERLARYARVAGTPLLVLGERGTGKTRIVETLVATLKRRRQVVTVPCGGLDSSLAESLLFGHRRGAFTGAAGDRAGLLAEADGGILCLDEVQDLPKPAQRKLVRVFQDCRRRFRPLGSDEEQSVDVELVCASNLDAADLRTRLDPDLYDRISHRAVEIPPLHECREDVADDWRRVWRELRRQDSLPPDAPWTPSLERALARHELPGNLRDLLAPGGPPDSVVVPSGRGQEHLRSAGRVVGVDGGNAARGRRPGRRHRPRTRPMVPGAAGQVGEGAVRDLNVRRRRAGLRREDAPPGCVAGRGSLTASGCIAPARGFRSSSGCSRAGVV